MFEPPEGTTIQSPEPDQLNSEAESKLSDEIQSLWSAHRDGRATARRTREELKVLRDHLGERLSEMKGLLARTGRSGGWASYLRSHRLPRATAERYVRLHEASLHPELNRPTGTISNPSEKDVHRLVQSLLPRLGRVLTTPQSVTWFTAEVSGKLAAVNWNPVDNRMEGADPATMGSSDGLHAAMVLTLAKTV